VELPGHRGGTSAPIPAMVVHRSEHGVGLMFRQRDARAAKVLKYLLRDLEAESLSSTPALRRHAAWFGGAAARG